MDEGPTPLVLDDDDLTIVEATAPADDEGGRT
jgi:hypothetical protein